MFYKQYSKRWQRLWRQAKLKRLIQKSQILPRSPSPPKLPKSPTIRYPTETQRHKIRPKSSVQMAKRIHRVSLLLHMSNFQKRAHENLDNCKWCCDLLTHQRINAQTSLIWQILEPVYIKFHIIFLVINRQTYFRVQQRHNDDPVVNWISVKTKNYSAQCFMCEATNGLTDISVCNHNPSTTPREGIAEHCPHIPLQKFSVQLRIIWTVMFKYQFSLLLR